MTKENKSLKDYVKEAQERLKTLKGNQTKSFNKNQNTKKPTNFRPQGRGR